MTAKEKKGIPYTVSRVWGHPSPPTLDANVPANFNSGGLLFPQMIYGIEWEMENAFSLREDTNGANLRHLVNVKHDDSLRNNGLEYTYCGKGRSLEWVIHRMHELYLINGAIQNERTSTHVHVNCQNMTPYDVYNLMLLAVTLEDFLYTFTNSARKEDIYCVPLKYSMLIEDIRHERIMLQDAWGYYEARETNLLSAEEKRLYSNVLQRIAEKWPKYTGVNFLALQQFGTVEFRHLAGETSPEILIPWLNIIGKMKMYAMKRTMTELEEEIKNLNSNSEYERFLRNVFGSRLLSYFATSNIQGILEEGTMAAKLCMLPYPSDLLPEKSTQFGKYRGFLTDKMYFDSSLGKALGVQAAAVMMAHDGAGLPHANDDEEEHDEPDDDDDDGYMSTSPRLRIQGRTGMPLYSADTLSEQLNQLTTEDNT